MEYANNVRKFVAADAMYQNKEKMQKRYEEYFQAVQEDCDLQAETAIRFAEQNYDIMLELNDQLIQYCQVRLHDLFEIFHKNIISYFNVCSADCSQENLIRDLLLGYSVGPVIPFIMIICVYIYFPSDYPILMAPKRDHYI